MTHQEKQKSRLLEEADTQKQKSKIRNDYNFICPKCRNPLKRMTGSFSKYNKTKWKCNFCNLFIRIISRL